MFHSTADLCVELGVRYPVGGIGTSFIISAASLAEGTYSTLGIDEKGTRKGAARSVEDGKVNRKG